MVQRPPAGTIPDEPGSYQFKDINGRVIYVGKAKSLRSRLSNYFQDPVHLAPRTAQMVATAETVEWIQVRNELEALMLEYSLIKQHEPRFNIDLRDDKSYPFSISCCAHSPCARVPTPSCPAIQNSVARVCCSTSKSAAARVWGRSQLRNTTNSFAISFVFLMATPTK
jgi:hypothetical protein